MMKLTTAGESHGKALVAIIEGLPAHLRVDMQNVNAKLALRQSGYGRGGRQKIEKDQAEILTGVRNGETLGSPVTLCIYNKDYANWEACMSAGACDEAVMQKKSLTKVRPGHADLSGVIKYGQTDARNILERASARETAIRVAAGAVFAEYLSALGVQISSYVKEICGVKDTGEYTFADVQKAKTTQTGMLDEQAEALAIEKITQLKADGDTAGGVVEIRVKGLKSGFGSHTTYDSKLDARLAQSLMSIQAVKGVEVGMGFGVASVSGKAVHDEIAYDENKGFYRTSNRAGGIEGGMSNGEEIVLRIAMKPIPTLMKGLKTVDYVSKQETVAAAERSDVCAIFALSIIAESAVAKTLAETVAERLGGDTMEEVTARYNALP
ncbi:MAG: chorismate synthase [Clostridia bacterium]|nr:chorismate synthase [Clostridia bacterium]